MDGLTVPAPRTSVEKLEDVLDQLAAAKGTDTTQKLLLTTLKSLLPTLRRGGYIPSDPVELDHLLSVGAGFALSMRSDPPAEETP